MTSIRRTPIFYPLAAAVILTFLCAFLSGCGPHPVSPDEEISSPELSGQGKVSTVGSVEPAEGTKEYYFYDDGIKHVRLFSEDITASFEFCYGCCDPDENPRFKTLVPLYEDIPQNQLGEKIEGLPAIERDWQVYEHRLSEVNYNLKVHYSLESEIDRIIQRLLGIDGVIPADSEMFFDENVRWLNTEIFDRFVSENVNIEIVGEDSEADHSDLTSGLSWQVYSGGCVPQLTGYTADDTVCAQHFFNIWLIDYSDEYITVWDMKYVDEPGCGELLPMYKA